MTVKNMKSRYVGNPYQLKLDQYTTDNANNMLKGTKSSHMRER